MTRTNSSARTGVSPGGASNSNLSDSRGIKSPSRLSIGQFSWAIPTNPVTYSSDSRGITSRFYMSVAIICLTANIIVMVDSRGITQRSEALGTISSATRLNLHDSRGITFQSLSVANPTQTKKRFVADHCQVSRAVLIGHNPNHLYRGSAQHG